MQNTGEVYGQNGAVVLIHRRLPGAQRCIFCRVLT
jgi:hypothetical protein